jgi:hypothetical protein
MCKNRATEALDRKQTELKALNNELKIQVKSQAGENELTKGLLHHEKRVEKELLQKLEGLKVLVLA